MIGLDAYLDAALAKRWRWGGMDCCFFAGDWVVGATGRDPLGPYRGLYDTALSARRIIMARGGLAHMVAETMMRHDFKEVGEAEHGDVGVMRVPSIGETAVAHAAVVIRSGPWWMARTLDGVVGLDAKADRVWRVR